MMASQQWPVSDLCLWSSSDNRSVSVVGTSHVFAAGVDPMTWCQAGRMCRVPTRVTIPQCRSWAGWQVWHLIGVTSCTWAWHVLTVCTGAMWLVTRVASVEMCPLCWGGWWWQWHVRLGAVVVTCWHWPRSWHEIVSHLSCLLWQGRLLLSPSDNTANDGDKENEDN